MQLTSKNANHVPGLKRKECPVSTFKNFLSLWERMEVRA
jgi:hypothetical protein